MQHTATSVFIQINIFMANWCNYLFLDTWSCSTQKNPKIGIQQTWWTNRGRKRPGCNTGSGMPRSPLHNLPNRAGTMSDATYITMICHLRNTTGYKDPCRCIYIVLKMSSIYSMIISRFQEEFRNAIYQYTDSELQSRNNNDD